MAKKLSLTFRFLRAIGFNYSEEEYGDVSLFRVIGKFFGNIYHALLLSMMDWWILEPFNPRKLRPFLLRRLGCKVGKGVFIGDHVVVDMNHADLIEIDDYAHITGGCRLLCHQRDLSNYHVGDNAAMAGYKLGHIHIGKGCMIGMTTMIMPGVTIGDGAIVGAGSLVTKDIPAWTVATGRPAKVVKQIPEREK
ncbi:MAG: acyltransferase [Alistipes sp.]|nr:acyltransferase [Alistipes sp.]